MKYVPGLMVGQLSGKAGSTVASRNRAGSYFRTRTIPKLVRNTRTTAVRAEFTQNSQLYRGITDEQRAGWTSLGSNLSRKNSLGETIRLTGSQAFQSVNSNIHSFGGTQLRTAPAQIDPATVGLFNFVATAGGPGTTTVVAGANSATQNVTDTSTMYAGAVLHFPATGDYRQVLSVTDATHVVLNLPVDTTTADTVEWTDLPTMHVYFSQSPLAAGTYVLINMTGPLSAGISRPSRGAYRLVTQINPGDAAPVDLAEIYFDTFGLPTAGSKIFISAKPISLSGIAGSNAVAVADVT